MGGIDTGLWRERKDAAAGIALGVVVGRDAERGRGVLVVLGDKMGEIDIAGVDSNTAGVEGSMDVDADVRGEGVANVEGI